MQIGVGSGYHIGKRVLRIWKRALSRLRYESNTTKGSPETIGVRGVLIVEPKRHVIRLAGRGREDLINKTVASSRAGK